MGYSKGWVKEMQDGSRKGGGEDRAEEVLTSENYRTHGFKLVSHDQQLPGPCAEALNPQLERQEEWKGRDKLKEAAQGAP